MGGAGTAVNTLAVAYGAFMAINIGWPRNEIYGAGNYMWGGLIFIVGAHRHRRHLVRRGGPARAWACSTPTARLEEEALLAREQAFGGP